jgi:heparin/heparan-sulfate lyase
MAAIALSGLTCAQKTDEFAWLKKVRTDHPRMFINKEILTQVRERAAGPERELFVKLKAEIDENIAANKDIGYQVYEGVLPTTMLVYYVTGDKKYLDRSRQLFKDGTEYVAECFQKKKVVSWFSFARIGLYMGYDWLYDQLTPDERKKYGCLLMQNVLDMQEPAKESDRIDGENYYGFPEGGFYGTQNLFWYAGLAFYKDGINDRRAEEFLKKGYADHLTVMEFRKKVAGTDGGLGAIVMGYVFGAYPRAEWNFYHTWASGVGENIAPRWDHLALLPNWLVWNIIPGHVLRQFSSGDAHHETNGMELDLLHLRQIVHFYGASHPRYAALAKFLADLAPQKSFETYFWAGLYPFLLESDTSAVQAQGPDSTWPHARFFPVLGQVFMRSGFGPDDTYCLFTAGAEKAGHKHFDENNFEIYKKGYLAMDTGTRDHGAHTTEYYSRTIAHNCILIKKEPREGMPHHWGNRPRLNDGGQNSAPGASLRAFETNDNHTYLVSDATTAYDTAKATQVVRQFLFVYPDHFIILDRVTSTDKNYPKTWLLHTQNEPQIHGEIFSAVEGDGRIFCRTLLPVQAVIKKVGGLDQDFMVEGKNFPVEKDFYAGMLKRSGNELPLVGHWRMEVAPPAAQESDVFLHVIQVGAKELQAMDGTKLEEDGPEYRLTITRPDRTVMVRFDKNDMLKGGIIVKKGETVLMEKEFSRDVQKQTGIAGK